MDTERAERNGRRRQAMRSRWAAVGAAVAVSLGGGGWFVANAAGGAESSTVLVAPVRVLDSRDPTNVGLNGPFVSAVSQKLQITGPIPTTAGPQTVVPQKATGVLLNVTVVGATADGFISIRPGDASGPPATSSLNFTAGTTLPNAVVVALPPGGPNAGKIDITFDAYGAAGPTTDVLIDVVGYTTIAKFDALQAEIDAAEQVNVTQQLQLNAKPGVDAVNAAVLRSTVWPAAVFGNGAKAGTGNFTSQRTVEGTYNITWNVAGLGLPDPFPGSYNITATTRCAGHIASISTTGFNATGGFVTAIDATVQVRDSAGAAADCAVNVVAVPPQPNVVLPPIPVP